MNYYELDDEEQKILSDFEKGEFEPVSDMKKELLRYQSYATQTLSRTRNINIRISERDLHKIKAKAIEKGMPYQTLIASLLHQYNNRSM